MTALRVHSVRAQGEGWRVEGVPILVAGRGWVLEGGGGQQG